MKLKRIFQWFFGRKKSSPLQNEMRGGKSEMMQKMMAMLSNTQDVELTCDEVYALLDQFVELAAQGEDVAQLMPLVKQHLDMCEDCREEYKVLESIVMNVA